MADAPAVAGLPTPPAADVPTVKPAIQTTEFWTHLLLQVFLGATIPALLKALAVALPASGLPPAIITVAIAVITWAMVWLQREYADNRTELKDAAMTAGAAAAADPVAAANS